MIGAAMKHLAKNVNVPDLRIIFQKKLITHRQLFESLDLRILQFFKKTTIISKFEPPLPPTFEVSTVFFKDPPQPLAPVGETVKLKFIRKEMQGIVDGNQLVITYKTEIDKSSNLHKWRKETYPGWPEHFELVLI